METITAKTPWEPFMGEVPMHLDYFRGSMFEAVEKIALEHPPLPLWARPPVAAA